MLVRRRIALLTACLVTSATLTGCDEDRVRSYRAPKEESAAKPITWRLPAGWRQSSKTGRLRYATLLADELEVTVTRLDGSGGGIAENITRWRTQIGLGPATEKELRQTMEPIQAGAGRAFLLNMVGPGPKSDDATPSEPVRLMAGIYPTRRETWFIKMRGPISKVDPHVVTFGQFARSVHLPGQQLPSVLTDAPRADRQASLAPRFSVPQDWRPGAPKRMAIATFLAGDQPDAPIVTVTPLAGAAGGLLPNLNRWRQQVGLGKIDSLTEHPPRKLDIAGQEADTFDIAGPPGSDGAAQHILVTVYAHKGTTWFYKMTGASSAVAKQKGNFEAFVRSSDFSSE